jgi:hypothetical protein
MQGGCQKGLEEVEIKQLSDALQTKKGEQYASISFSLLVARIADLAGWEDQFLKGGVSHALG